MSKDSREPSKNEDGARLLRIVFVSHASIQLSPTALRMLETCSARRNEAAGITGLLIAHGAHFYGIMEGPQEALLERMEVIITDDRHHGLRILGEDQVSSRRFSDWRLFHLPAHLGTGVDRAPGPAFIFELSRRLRSF
jgi:hypothetical protein